MALTLKRFEGQLISPSDDAIIYDSMLNFNGIVRGGEMVFIGGNQITISSGRGIIKGREFTIEDETIKANLVTTGSAPGRLLIRMDLSNTDAPAQFATQVGTEGKLPNLIQDEDCNYDTGIYELELATYTVTETAITNFTVTATETNAVATLGRMKYITIDGTLAAGQQSPNITAPHLLNIGEMAVIQTTGPISGFGKMRRTTTRYALEVETNGRIYTNAYTGGKWQGWERKKTIYTATLAAAGWDGTTAPYIQTINVAGIFADDTGVFDIATADKDLATAEQLQAEGAKIVDITINNGSITARAKEKIVVDLPIFWHNDSLAPPQEGGSFESVAYDKIPDEEIDLILSK